MLQMERLLCFLWVRLGEVNPVCVQSPAAKVQGQFHHLPILGNSLEQSIYAFKITV